MRLLLSLLLLPILFGSALADEALTVPQTPASETQVPPASLAVQPPKTPTRRLTWQQHFAQANLAHDGHLTRDEATTGGFPLVAKYFDDIDADHKAYVTENDVRSWRAMRSAARRLARRPTDKLKPVHAFQLRPPVQLQPLPLQTASVPARVAPALRATRIGN
jgi:hypothetical protein